ncbi:MAG: DUF6273 domain-containing protein [Oscillospiraceae bacterium]|jgi:hypothetical protein|nr:DUF6273 domain-containing protein [Oscillospiraceae bacterium]
MKRRLFAVALTVALVLSLLPAAVVSAEDTGSAMYPDADIVAAYDGTYDYVYYGEYGGIPVLWRVLDNETNTGSEGLFLLSEYALDSGNVQFDGSSPYSNVWQGSAAQNWSRDFYDNAFSALEQSAVIETSKDDAQYTSGEYSLTYSAVNNILSDDTVFFLSAKEAETYDYGFVVGSAGNATRVAKTGSSGGAAIWWLRSPYAGSSYGAGIVITSGNVDRSNVDNNFAARPAFNFDLGSVIFTSAAVGGKSGAVGAALGKLATGPLAAPEYKFTLADGVRDFDASVTGLSGGTLSLSYTGATVGTNEYISAVIADSNDNIKYYGTVAKPSVANGTASIELPGDYATEDDTVYVFSEQKNGDYYTDYASALVALDIPATEPESAPVVSGGEASLVIEEGYLSVGSTLAFTITGNPEPEVTKLSGDAKITWNSVNNTIDVAPGLAFGNYPAKFKVSNGIGQDKEISFVAKITKDGEEAGSYAHYKDALTVEISASVTGESLGELSPLGGIDVSSLTQLNVGDTYDIDIYAEDIENVYDLAIPLVFDNAKLEVTAVVFNTVVPDFEQPGLNGDLSKYVPGSTLYDVDDVNDDGKLALWMVAVDEAADITTKVKLWTITVKAKEPTLYATPATTGDIISIGDISDYPGGGMLSFGVRGNEGDGDDPTAPGDIFTADLDFEGLEIVAPAAVRIDPDVEDTYVNTIGTIAFDAAVGWKDTSITGVTPAPDTITGWSLEDIVTTAGSTPPIIDASTGVLTVPSDFIGTAVVVVTADYNNNFASDRDANPDYPVDKMLVTFNGTNVIVGYYAKVDITEPASGTQYDPTTDVEIQFKAAVTWDNAKNNYAKEGVPDPANVTWSATVDGTSRGTVPAIDLAGELTWDSNDLFIGTLKVRATAVRDNPDGEYPYDEIIVVFTATSITVDVKTVELTGVVKLAKKVRYDITLFGFTARDDYDKGIKVSIVGVKSDGSGTVELTSATTDKNGNFNVGVPTTTKLYGNADYNSFKLVAVRSGTGSGGTLRGEEYLAMSVELTFNGLPDPEDGPIDLLSLAWNTTSKEAFWLFPSDYNADGSIKATDDYAEIKAKVGLTASETSYNTKYDINEYTGIDGGDLASVKSGVGRAAGADNYNPGTIAVN